MHGQTPKIKELLCSNGGVAVQSCPWVCLWTMESVAMRLGQPPKMWTSSWVWHCGKGPRISLCAWGGLHSWLHRVLHCVARLSSLALTTASLVFCGDTEASTRLELQLTWLKGAECPGLCNGAGNARLLLGSRTRHIEWVLLWAGHLLMARSSHCCNRVCLPRAQGFLIYSYK